MTSLENGKGSYCKGRRGVAGFYFGCHFSISQLRDSSAYLLSVAVLPLHRPKEEGQLPNTAQLPTCALGQV